MAHNGTITQPITHQEKIRAVKNFIGRCHMPVGPYVPARKMTWDQARDVVLALAAEGRLEFDDSVYDHFTVRSGDDGAIVVTPPAQPRANAGMYTEAAVRKGLFTVRPASLYGVKFYRVAGWLPGNNMKTAVMASLNHVDPRFLVMMARLCKLLQEKYTADRVFAGGISSALKYKPDGTISHPDTNSHWWGRACDFYGVGGEAGWGRYEINVKKHWGQQPITMPVDWGPISATTHKHQYEKGKDYAPTATHPDPWPDGFHDTVYRLEIPEDSQTFATWIMHRDAHVGLASAIFKDVYNHIACEGHDTANANDPPTTIGHVRTSICHPDHHGPGIRRDHNNHMHIEIGPTEHTGWWWT